MKHWILFSRFWGIELRFQCKIVFFGFGAYIADGRKKGFIFPIRCNCGVKDRRSGIHFR